MTPAVPLCNPIDVFRVRDAEADAIALCLAYQASRTTARTAGALVERLVETRRLRLANRERATSPPNSVAA